MNLDDAERQVREQLVDFERRRIEVALASCAGNQTAAARMLGLSRRTLLKRLDSHDLPRPRKGRAGDTPD